MSWCDKLAAAPTVGFRLTAHYVPIDGLLSAFSPILDRVPTEQAKHVTIEQSNTNFSTSFVTHDGFKYAATETNVSVAFQHKVRYRAVSGGAPTMEMLSTPMPFTTLLPDVSTKLVEATLLLPKVATRKVVRVGVVTTAALAEEDLPPGIRRFMEYVGRPWNGKFHSYNINLTSELSSNENSTERCTHLIAKSEDEDQLMTVQFDWQRIFEDGWDVRKENLERLLDDARRDALKYFEDLAEGSRFDEELLRETVGA